MTQYDHKEIEKKWQKVWEEKKAFKAIEEKEKPKYYVLDMFPYPSGAGLHVGHLVGYTATDIVSRYKRMKGFSVLHPMGWDSFGLPAEQYAVRTGTHPSITTKDNINNFRRELKTLGYSYDWDREVATSDARYYKWTQWIFTKLYEKGLAYEAEISVNFCPHLGTVLANEEVDNGFSKEGGFKVIKKPLRQWVLKITEYADRLIQDLDLLDWPESIKSHQTNWIGRSEGGEITFKVENSSEEIVAYTTRLDTLPGATFVAIAPEHSLVDKITAPSEYKTVSEYREHAVNESEIERSEAKTGAFTGAYAINPINQEKLPIYVADYVLPHYGTGAVMAVPAHCQRDFEFAQNYKVPMKQVIEVPEHASEEEKSFEKAYEGYGTLINSSYAGLETKEAKEKILSDLEKEGFAVRKVHYKLRDWLFSRQRYWGEPIPILHFENGEKRTLGLDELPLCPPDMSDFKPAGDGHSPLYKAKEWIHVEDSVTGKKAQRESNTMPQWAGSCWYYLRFCDARNENEAWSKDKESYWLPVDLYVGGTEHAVLHLLYARFWHKVLYDLGLVSHPEPFKKLVNQGLVVARSYKNEQNMYVSPKDVKEKNGKYIHKATGEELKSQIDKMSKSKLNGVTPNELVEEYGADTLRLFEMFLGPLEKEKVWTPEAVVGCKRFLNRIYDIFHSDKVTDNKPSEAALMLINKLIIGVDEDLSLLQFNTPIAKMMEFLNDFVKQEEYSKEVLSDFVKVLSLYAPHMGEELWSYLGHSSLVSLETFPKGDPSYVKEESATYVLQVNGKLRGNLEMPLGSTKEDVEKMAKEHENVSKHLVSKTVRKVIFVPEKLLNFVVS